MIAKTILAAALAALPLVGAAQGSPLAAATQAEIDHLLEYIAHSDCRFSRNGSWHGMGEAREHIEMKYQSLRGRGKVRDTEDFIENAAARSSLTGKNYLVQCPGQAEVPSTQWLGTELARFRQRPKR
ncbi:MAG: DUF5329 domain-containing protein [Burkholderiales bacterium]|nr:DUF5329 domain-containing protein [Burkholderiales bacterium]